MSKTQTVFNFFVNMLNLSTYILIMAHMGLCNRIGTYRTNLSNSWCIRFSDIFPGTLERTLTGNGNSLDGLGYVVPIIVNVFIIQYDLPALSDK